MLPAPTSRLTGPQTGYPLLSNLLQLPSPQTFHRVIGVTNRNLSRSISQLPEDERIELYAGLDLLNREQSLGQIRQIPGIEYTTHVYFAAYTGHGSSYADLRAVNEAILVNALGAVEICCPALRFWTLQTGGKVRITRHRTGTKTLTTLYRPTASSFATKCHTTRRCKRACRAFPSLMPKTSFTME